MRLLVSVLILIDFYCLSLFFHGLFLPWPSFIKCCYTWLFYEDYFTISYLSCCNLLDKTSKYVKSNDSWMHFVKLINKKLYKRSNQTVCCPLFKELATLQKRASQQGLSSSLCWPRHRVSLNKYSSTVCGGLARQCWVL